jgi:GT2 family glycosyltransferase
MGTLPRFSIIIPVKEINDYVRETVPYIQTLDLENWELIIVPNGPDQNEWESDKRISLFSSGRVGPADKRDQAAKIAKGEILVFLDDDSYPKSDLLSIATTYFDDNSVSAIGGPAITPESDTYWQKVSGAVFLSKFTGGNPERYIPVGMAREVDDWPSVNFMVRKSDFVEVGGFDSPYWPGEDTHFCLKLMQKTKKIMYAPELIVWHHRRSGLLRHMKQVGAYGLHRGYFARHMPKTSMKIKYLLPSFFTLTVLVLSVAAYVSAEIRFGLFSVLTTYVLVLLLGAIDVSKKSDFHIAVGAMIYVLPTHLYYGIQFLRGYIKTGKLVSALR